ncbi:MAG TPA: M14 family metallopeptidase [Saprospiraceae bacterium]|nr:M14 family metallopeptidase [Saprospiraceae bacterium]
MKSRLIIFLCGSLLCFSTFRGAAQSDYRSAEQVSNDLQALVRQYTQNAQIQSLTLTPNGHDIWALTLSKGQPQDRPGLAIVGGVDGRHLLSVELAAQLAKDILENHPDWLDKTTFYIFPNMNPDATEQYFQSLQYERHGNGSNTDEDRDGRLGEDPYEDLNGDGLITMIRVEDPTGDYIPLEAEPRIMVKADREQGQSGRYKLFTEGQDNDQDGAYNEDGPGGVSFNRNLTYNFPYFTPHAGEHPVSQKETRALLDFLYEQWNLYGILTFGPANNLSSPLKYNRTGATKRVVTSILREDAEVNALLSKRYNQIIADDNVPPSVTEGGGFFEWSYFHFGRLAMSTPGWWAPKPEKDSTQASTTNREANFLRWAEQNDLDEVFVEWTEIDHPDFPRQKVEVGGFAPHIMQNPPYAMIGSVVEKHSDFLQEVIDMQASVELINLQTESLGDNLTRITVDLHNPGLLPTQTQMGDRSRWLRKIKVQLKLTDDQSLISGREYQLYERLAADESVQLTWLVRGSGSLELSAGAAHTGVETLSIKL